MPRLLIRTSPNFCVFTLLILATLVAPLGAQTLRSCLGTGQPEVTDGAFACNSSDIVPGSGELGNFLFVDFQPGASTATLSSVTVSFDPSANAQIASRVAFFPDNLAGVTVVSESLVGNTFTASFQNFTGGVNTFVLGFNFNQTNTGTGTPVGSDYVGATISAVFSDGTVQVATYCEVDFFVALAAPDTFCGPPPSGINVTDISSLCVRRPWLCTFRPTLMRPERLVLECPVRDCVVIDWIPENCLRKFDCPGCSPGGLCPPYYQLSVQDPSGVWEVGLYHSSGRPVPHQRRRTKDSLVMSFRPAKEHYLERQIGDYFVGFKMGPNGKPGTRYEVRMRVEKSERPLESVGKAR